MDASTARRAMADDCARGNVCVFESARIPLNLCRLFCRGDVDCKNGGRCAFTLQGGTLKVCSDPVSGCNAAANAGCQGGGCIVVTDDGQTGCHAAGPGGQFAPCDGDYDCRGGHACFGGFVGCLKICRRGVHADCPNGLKCWDVPGWAAWGACDFP